jgi:hypothetical protein
MTFSKPGGESRGRLIYYSLELSFGFSQKTRIKGNRMDNFKGYENSSYNGIKMIYNINSQRIVTGDL